MEKDYMDILVDWEERVAKPAIYEHLDELFPSYGFVRRNAGDTRRDHWASRYKIDLTIPRFKNAEKTVVYASEMLFREQGDWAHPISVVDRYLEIYRLHDLMSFYKDVARRLGLSYPAPTNPDVRKALENRSRQVSLLDTLVDYFCWNLENNTSLKASAVRTYIKKHRGLTLDEAAQFRLGFVPDWNKVVRYITIDRNFPLDDLNDVCGVPSADGYTAVGATHTLAIPYECGGVVKGFLFRRVDDTKNGPKYLANTDLDRKSVFFNIPADSDPKDIVVVEGEMDAITASVRGVPGVVAIGGSEIAGERRRQVEDAFRRGVKRITLCLDLDLVNGSGEANQEARHSHVMKSVHTIKDVDPSFEEIYVACFKAPSDPDQFIRERGVEEFRRMIDEAEPYWKYLYNYMKENQ